MEIVQENRIRAALIFIVSAGLGLFFVWELVNEGADIFSGLWISLKMVLALGVAFFAFQNIFYQRLLSFNQGFLRFQQRGLGANEARSEALTNFEGLEVKWLYSRLPGVSPKLELRLKHAQPEWSLELLRQSLREDRETFVARVNEFQKQSGLTIVNDESGIWKS